MIVVYDFDKTLTYKDTLFGFFKSFSKNPLKIILYFIAMVLAKFKVISNSALKKFGVFLFIRGKDKDEVQRVSKEYAKSIKTNKIYDEVETISQKNRVLIVSASFEDYLKELFSKRVQIVASKLEYKDNKVSSVLFNCYSKSKLEVLKQMGVLKIDRFFTDSYSDKALAEISQEIVIVNKDDTMVCKDIDEFKGYFNR